MKKIILVLLTAIFSLLPNNGFAEKQIAGPNGGKLLENEAPRAEFLIEKDHTVTINFFDEALKPVPAGDQVVVANAESKSGKVKLEFEKKGSALKSKSSLPPGDGYTIVVQVRKTVSSAPQNFRIKYDAHICGECKLQEYACVCH